MQLLPQQTHDALSFACGSHGIAAAQLRPVADVGDLYTQAAIGCVDDDIRILSIAVNTTAWHGMDALELLERPQFLLLLASAAPHITALLDLEHLHHLVAKVVDDLDGEAA